jgi:SAM-dependent methyltransferase
MASGPKTDYAGHDARYRRLREQGAPGWDSDDGYREREAELALAFAAIDPVGTRLLEIGCGAGNLAGWFADRGFDVTGIDISPAAIEWATERAIARARFLVGDVVAELQGTYDVIIDGHCLHCIIGDDRARLLANVHDALAPGGHFFVATMCGAITNAKLRACFDPVTRCQVVDGVAYRYIGDAVEILAELRAAGFEIVRSTVDPRTTDEDQDDLWTVVRRSA